MANVYGPVPSRRLGRSIGIDVIPKKTCNFNCIYCQLGRTNFITNKREEFFPIYKIFSELQSHIKKVGSEAIDYLTLVGDGEPTLYSKLGILLKKIKSNFDIPVAVITNGALMYNEDIRNELLSADVILPTLDAGNEKQFRYINRPICSVKYHDMIEGMVEFRKSYHGLIWMEYMALKGINDDKISLKNVRKSLKLIKPDRVYINVPIRPPAEPWVKIPDDDKVAHIQTYLERWNEIIDIKEKESGYFYVEGKDPELVVENLIEVIKRHPMRLSQVKQVLLEKKIEEIDSIIQKMKKKNLVHIKKYQGEEFVLPFLVKKEKKGV